MTFRSQALLLALSLLSALALTGCGLGTPATSTPQTMHLNITGNVHGGQQPVAGARIFVFQADSTGYGDTSVDLIGIDIGTLAGSYDSTYNARYVSTNATGGFTITGDYQCSGSGPFYVLATQGNPGLGAGKSNPALAELAVVANSCGTQELASNLNIGITEQSTVTGIYALAGYMTAPNKVSSNGSNSALSLTGITNAATTALGLSDLPSGSPLATTAAGATLPTAKINLLADIIAACVNSAGATSTGSPCGTLFTAATPAGGTVPGDTVTALLNIAHNPALTTANIASLYSLASATAPYQPYTTIQPTDLTLSLTYPTFKAPNGGSPTAFTQPAFDAAGRLAMPGFVLGIGEGYLVLRDPQGNVLSQQSAFPYVLRPSGLTIDNADRSWLVGSKTEQNDANSTSIERDTITSTGTNTTTYFSNGTDTGFAIASDASGNIFLAENNNEKITEFDSSGAPGNTYLASNKEAFTGLTLDNSNDLFATSSTNNKLSAISLASNAGNAFGDVPNSTSTTNLNQPSALAVDSAGSVWVTNLGNSTIAKFTVAQLQNVMNGTAYTFPLLIPAANAYAGGGMSFAAGNTGRVPIVMDGASAAWVPNYTGQSISAFSNAGTALSPAASGSFTGGFATPGCQAQGVAVDGSGNVWVTCDTGTPSMVEFLGLATPVATPILPGQLGVRP